jgi:hypothetical protein
LIRENEAWEAATGNSEINTVLMNSLIKKHTGAIFFALSLTLFHKLQYLVLKKKRKKSNSLSCLLLQIISVLWELSKGIFKKDAYPGENIWEKTSGHKKCLQRKNLITQLDRCPEGSIWQDLSFV